MVYSTHNIQQMHVDIGHTRRLRSSNPIFLLLDQQDHGFQVSQKDLHWAGVSRVEKSQGINGTHCCFLGC